MKNVLVAIKNKQLAILKVVILVISSLAMAKLISLLGGFPMMELLYPLARCALYIALISFMVEKTKKVKRFFDAHYNNPDLEMYSEANSIDSATVDMITKYDVNALEFIPMKKLKPKAMFKSMLKYFAVIFILIACSHSFIMIALIPVYIVVMYCVFLYFKLWKHHGYSVPALLGLTAVVIAVGILLTPIVRAGAWIVIKAILRIPNIII